MPQPSMISLAKNPGLMPQEERLETRRKKKRLTIGIPKEVSYQENRVALVPESVGLLVNNGHHIVVEEGAGKAAHFNDIEYSEMGALVEKDRKEVFKADIILKVEPPSLNEIKLLTTRQTLISALQVTMQNENYINSLINKKISAVAVEYIKDKSGIFSVVQSMSEIVGSTSILIAAEYLSNVNEGNGLMLGGVAGVPPLEVVILGAGTVAEYATRASLGLGAVVKVFDNNIYKLRRLQNNLSNRIFTSIIEPKVLKNTLKSADVVVGAILATEGRAPCVVSEKMVQQMKPGSVVIDVSIDQGGCFETSKVTSHKEPIFRKHEVIHYCVPNIASRVSRTASYALSHIFAPILLNIGDAGGIVELLKKDHGVRNGVYLYNGIVTNKFVSDLFRLPYKDLDLLMAAI